MNIKDINPVELKEQFIREIIDFIGIEGALYFEHGYTLPKFRNDYEIYAVYDYAIHLRIPAQKKITSLKLYEMTTEELEKLNQDMMNYYLYVVNEA